MIKQKCLQRQLSRFKKKHGEVWKFIKFNITVIVTSCLDVALYLVLLYFVFAKFNSAPLPQNALLSLLGIQYKGYLYSYLISTSAGYIAAYLMNRIITFHSDVNPVYSSVMYFVLAAFNILFSSWFGGVAGSFMLNHKISNPFTEIVAKFIIINIPTIWTYPLERFVIQIKKPKKRKIIATDLDGTLLASNTKITAENLNSINNLAKNGVNTVIVTGRTLYEIPEELLNCGNIEYYIYSNGAVICDKNKNVIFSRLINRDDGKAVFDILNSFNTFIEFYSSGYPVTDSAKFNEESFAYYKIDPAFLPELRRSRVPVSDFYENSEKYLSDLEMFDVFFENQEERRRAFEIIKSRFPYLELTTSMDNNMEIMSRGFNKGNAIKTLCKTEKISIKSVVALGDSKNDLTMFKTVKNCFAVANACDELKKISKKIICTNDENVMCFMEKYFNKEVAQ